MSGKQLQLNQALCSDGKGYVLVLEAQRDVYANDICAYNGELPWSFIIFE